jgi:hypothetical protein
MSKRRQPTRAQTRALKAERLAEALGPNRTEGALQLSASEPEDPSEQPHNGDPVDGAETGALPTQADVLKEEIARLRKLLAEKTAEYRGIAGNTKQESATVERVLALLGNAEGISKADLVAKTGAKKGYVDALLSRILPARGYLIDSIASADSRARIYRLASEGTPEEP